VFIILQTYQIVCSKIKSYYYFLEIWHTVLLTYKRCYVLENGLDGEDLEFFTHL